MKLNLEKKSGEHITDDQVERIMRRSTDLAELMGEVAVGEYSPIELKLAICLLYRHAVQLRHPPVMVRSLLRMVKQLDDHFEMEIE